MNAEALSRPYERSPIGISQLAFHCLVHGILRNFVKLEVENPPDLVRNSPIILAPNHVSLLDPPILQLSVRHHITFLMTEVIHSKWPFTNFFRFWQTIPVPENRPSASAIKTALKVIRQGRPVCIFPEGGISDDGYLMKGQGGVVTLMARSQVPVVPVAILGTFRMFPRGARLLRPGRVIVRYGKPIDPPQRPSRDRLRSFAGEIMDSIHDLGAPRHGDVMNLERFHR